MRRILLRMGLVNMLPVMITGAAVPLVYAEDPVRLASNDEQPDLEFLLFLGEQKQVNGEWIDPVQLMEPSESGQSSEEAAQQAALSSRAQGGQQDAE